MRCICEQNAACLQVYYADRFNESREIEITDAETGDVIFEQDERFVPDWVRLVALETELACQATHHFTAILAEEWLGHDVIDSTDENRRDQLAAEDEALMIAHSTRDDGALTGADLERFESREQFIERAMIEKKRMLARLTAAVGGDHRKPEWIAFVNDCIEKKRKDSLDSNGLRTISENQIRLRGYARALAMLAARVEDGTLQLR